MSATVRRFRCRLNLCSFCNEAEGKTKEKAGSIEKMIDPLEDADDVQNVFANLEMSDES